MTWVPFVRFPKARGKYLSCQTCVHTRKSLCRGRICHDRILPRQKQIKSSMNRRCCGFSAAGATPNANSQGAQWTRGYWNSACWSRTMNWLLIIPYDHDLERKKERERERACKDYVGSVERWLQSQTCLGRWRIMDVHRNKKQNEFCITTIYYLLFIT